MTKKKIVIDHREHADTLVDTLMFQYGFEIDLMMLKAGDYFIEPDIIVERKTTRDFIVSIIDGRLFKQAYQLAEHTQRPIIIVEGKNYKDTGVDFSIDCVKGALIALAQTFHIPVLRTKDERDTAWYFNQMFEQRNRVGQNRGSLFGYKGKKIETQKLHLLRTLPGIGSKTAKELLEYFDSISDIINASEKELMKIEGIGKTTAKRIKNVVLEELVLYAGMHND